jgi:hypothetical protein
VISTITRAQSLNSKYPHYKLEQHPGYPTISVKSAPLPTSQFHGCVRVVNPLRCRKSYGNALSFGQTRSTVRREVSHTPGTNRQAGSDRKSFELPEGGD